MNKFQILGKSYTGLTENDSRYYELSLLRTLSWYQSDNFIVLTLDKADTLYYSYNIIMYNYSLLFIIDQNTVQKVSGMFIFTSIPKIV